MTILVLAVGGSPSPVVNAVRQNAADGPLDHVFFLCSSSSSGSGSDSTIEEPIRWAARGDCPQCGERFERRWEQPGIAQQAGLERGSYTIERVEDPDDLRQVVEACVRIEVAIGERFPGTSVVANYTGGTKTMSFGLGLHALRRGWVLQVNATGRGRDNLERIDLGDVALVQEEGWLTVEDALERARDLEGRHGYAAAVAVLEALAASRRLPGEEREKVLDALDRCRMWAAWDRFDYRGALACARRSRQLAELHAARLSRLERTVRGLEGPAGRRIAADAAGELLEDLVANAARCAARGRFDDAVGRLYRATELAAQARLRLAYGLRTDDLDLAHPRLPPSSREWLEALHRAGETRVRISLVAAYRLLVEMDDPLGRHFEKSRRVMRFLEMRNQSLFAHGLEPIGPDRWVQVGGAWLEWLSSATEILRDGPRGRGGGRDEP